MNAPTDSNEKSLEAGNSLAETSGKSPEVVNAPTDSKEKSLEAGK